MQPENQEGHWNYLCSLHHVASGIVSACTVRIDFITEHVYFNLKLWNYHSFYNNNIQELAIPLVINTIAPIVIGTSFIYCLPVSNTPVIPGLPQYPSFQKTLHGCSMGSYPQSLTFTHSWFIFFKCIGPSEFPAHWCNSSWTVSTPKMGILVCTLPLSLEQCDVCYEIFINGS